jgi:hypothetical protein
MGDMPRAPLKYRAFVDFEYLNRGGRHPLVPISMGLVKHELSTGRRSDLYLEFALTPREANAVASHPWLRANVLPLLSMKQFVKREEAVESIAAFLELSTYRLEELWTWYGSHDLVILSGLHGAFEEQPRNLPMFTLDLRQWMYQQRIPMLMLPKHGREHHALDDAQRNALIHDTITRITTETET